MKSVDRRAFLGSAVGVGLGTMSGDTVRAQETVGIFSKAYNFQIGSELLTRLNDDGTVMAAAPWAISLNDADLAPYLSGERAVPSLDFGSQAQCGSCSADAIGDSSSPLVKRLLDFRLMGQLPATDLVSEIVQARVDNQYLDLLIRINDESTSDTNSDTAALASSGSRLLEKSVNVWQTPTVNGYFIQFRGPDYQGIVPCAPEAPKHYHAELWQVTSRGNIDIVNLHMAIWKNSSTRQYCFAVANSRGWPACIKVCTPTWSSIYQPILSTLLAVGLAYLIANVLASLLATMIAGSLAVLAV